MITITATAPAAKGTVVTLSNGATFTVGPAFSHVVVYQSGGWNPATRANDLWCASRHKGAAAAARAAAADKGTAYAL